MHKKKLEEVPRKIDPETAITLFRDTEQAARYKDLGIWLVNLRDARTLQFLRDIEEEHLRRLERILDKMEARKGHVTNIIKVLEDDETRKALNEIFRWANKVQNSHENVEKIIYLAAKNPKRFKEALELTKGKTNIRDRIEVLAKVCEETEQI